MAKIEVHSGECKWCDMDSDMLDKHNVCDVCREEERDEYLARQYDEYLEQNSYYERQSDLYEMHRREY